jgi:hypothetical protein
MEQREREHKKKSNFVCFVVLQKLYWKRTESIKKSSFAHQQKLFLHFDKGA